MTMTVRENLLSLYRRTGYETAPVSFGLCPSLCQTYSEREHSDLPYPYYFHFSEAGIADGVLPDTNTDTFLKY